MKERQLVCSLPYCELHRHPRYNKTEHRVNIHLTIMTIACLICLLPKLIPRIKYDICLKISFIIIWFYIGIRYEYGGDYTNYEVMFWDVKSGSVPDFDSLFYLLMSVFPHYYIFILFTSAIASISFYYLLKYYVDPIYYWFCILLIFLQVNLLILNCAAQRSALVVAIFIVAVRFIQSKKFIYYSILILIASAIHLSAIFLLPLYFLRYVKFNFVNQIIIVFLLITSLFAENYISDIIIYYVPLYGPDLIEARFSFYMAQIEETSREMALTHIPYILTSFLYLKYVPAEYKSKDENRIIMLLSIVMILLITFRIDMVGRYSMYLWPFYMIFIITILKYLKNHLYRMLLIVMTLFQSSWVLIKFFQQPYGKDFLNYKTIFSNLI